MQSPKQLGYVMPPEWNPVEAIWLSWPVAPHLWADVARPQVEQVFAELVTAIARFSEVRVCVQASEGERVSALLGEAATVFAIETDDVWCRDHGPTFLKNAESGEIALVDWVYNAWGGKFAYAKDAQVASSIGEAEGVTVFHSKLICEGGALESDGRQVLTTESVLLNPNRNPSWSKESITQELTAMLGVEEVIWLPAGLENDDTDGHIDMVARFVAPGAALAVEPVTPSLTANARLLEAAGLQVSFLPFVGEFSPGVDGSYANFLIVNEGILVPQYRLPQDVEACAIIQGAFPDHEIVPFDCSVLGLEGGGIHCLTQGQFR